MTKELQKEWTLFKTYVFEQRWYILVSSVILLLIYGSWVFHIGARIDTETVINVPETAYNWLQIGRQGLIFTEYVFGTQWFNPYLSTVFGYLLICIAGVLFGYIFSKFCEDAQNVSPVIYACFGLLYFSSPVFAEQFYFELQIFQIAWAFILCAAGVGLSYFGILHNFMSAKILAVLCMIWSFSSYQVFSILHITAVAICYVLLLKKWNVRTDYACHTKKCFGVLLEHILLFLCAFIVNTIITNAFFTEGEYLSEQVLWGKELWLTYCTRVILGTVFKAYTGMGTFYTAFYGIFSLLVIAATIAYLLKHKAMKLRWLYFCGVVFIQICPFLLVIYTGNISAVRTMLVYPFVMVGNIILLLAYCKKRYSKLMILLLAMMMVWNQSGITMRLIYTQDVCEQEDIKLAGQIEQRIAEVTSEAKPIAFIGAYKNHLNKTCLRGEMIGVSSFAVHYSQEPHYSTSTGRACGFAQALGFEFEAVTEEQLLEARKLALELPTWPAKESVMDAGDFIIVKFSEDEWLAELE